MKKVLVFGDSHSTYFNISSEMETKRVSNKINIKTISMLGSTIAGFGKRKSTLSVRETFLSQMELEKPDYVVFALGQVDMELGYFYRKVIKNEIVEMDKYIKSVLDVYIQSIVDLKKNKLFNNVEIIIKGINNPCLTHNRDKAINYTNRVIIENGEKEKIPEYTEMLKKIFPSAHERVKNHSQFNQSVRRACQKEGFTYFDLNDDLCSKKTGFVLDKFYPANEDHHIVDSFFIRKLHTRKLLNCIESINKSIATKN